MSEREEMTRAAGVVGGATAISRVLGYVRDAVVAYFFGATMSADAFFVAFRIPNLLRRLFAEGSLTIAFVPVFSEYLEKKGKDEALKMAGAAFRLLGLILAGVTILGVVFAPAIVKVIAPGFAQDPEKLALTVTLTRITFPYIFFIGLVALCMGILNTMRHFAAPALAPVFLNIAMIGSVALFASRFDPPILALAIGVIIGGVLQLALQAPFMAKKGFSLFGELTLSHPGIKQVAILMGPAVFGAAVYQINIVVGTILASLLPSGSVSYLYYADRLTQLPLGVFGIALATATLPSLSRQAAKNDMAGLKDSFSYSMGLVFFISAPAAVGLIILGEPIVAFLFQRGAFDQEATRLTAQALLCYALGLCAFSGVRIVVSVFYALQDTVTPVRIAVISLAANIVFSLALMGPMLHAGLALATSLASVLNLALLTCLLRKKLGLLHGKKILFSLLKSFLCAIGMGVVIYYCARGLGILPVLGVSGARLIWGTGLSVCAGVVAYGVFSRVIAKNEFLAVWSIVGQRNNKT